MVKARVKGNEETILLDIEDMLILYHSKIVNL